MGPGIATMAGMRKKSVLIVDDNRLVQESLEHVVQGAGFAPRTASSRREAMDRISHQRFDIALVDKRLVEQDSNNKDGHAILLHLAELGEGTCGVLFTGYGEYRDGVDAMGKSGAFAILEKTLDAAELERDVLEVLSNAAKERQTIPQPIARIWSGKLDSAIWAAKATSTLRPKDGSASLHELLEIMTETAYPTLDLPNQRGLTEVDGSLVGLIWSRGIGQAVVVVIGRGEPERSTIVAAESWIDCTVNEQLYRRKAGNLVGAIYGCDELEPSQFIAGRQP